MPLTAAQDFDRADYTDATGGITVNLGAGPGSRLQAQATHPDCRRWHHRQRSQRSFRNRRICRERLRTTRRVSSASVNSKVDGGDDEYDQARGNVREPRPHPRRAISARLPGVTVDIRDGEDNRNRCWRYRQRRPRHDQQHSQSILGIEPRRHPSTAATTDKGSFEAYEGRRGNDFIDGPRRLRSGRSIPLITDDQPRGSQLKSCRRRARWQCNSGHRYAPAEWRPCADPGLNDTFDATNFGAAKHRQYRLAWARSTTSRAAAETTPSSATAARASISPAHWRA